MPDDTIAEIRELEDRRYAAMCRADAPALEALLAEGLSYTHSNASTDSRSSYLDGVSSGKWKYLSIERPVENIQIWGDCAIVTGQVRIEILVQGAPKLLNSRHLNVWVKGAEGWRMAAWQSTPIPG